MFRLICVVSGLVAIQLSFVTPADAARQYRCYGRVQYRPCTPDDAWEPSAFRAAPRLGESAHPFNEVKGERFAKIISQDLSKVGKGDGLWKGSVHGNGLVELALKVFRGDQLESTRYMGSVWLKNKTSKFRFRATLPQGKNWRWEIVAWAS